MIYSAFSAISVVNPSVASVPSANSKDDEHDERREEPHLFLTNNHKKNGPPMSAVMTPTGNSMGAMTVRATTSHPIKKAAPNNAEAGSTRR